MSVIITESSAGQFKVEHNAKVPALSSEAPIPSEVNPVLTTFTVTAVAVEAWVFATEIKLILTDVQTAALAPGRQVYDILLTAPDGTKERVVEGMAIIRDGVT